MLQTQYVRESMNQYFVIERNGEWEDSYEEKLFGVAEIPYFMSYDIRQINGSAAFYYHMIFRTSLKQAFECVEFTSRIIENIIRSIVGVLEVCNEYLIEADNILFDSEYVFFDIETGMLKFCYYYDKKCGITIRELVMEILQHVDKKYEQGSLRLLKFYHLLTDPDASAEKLKSFLDEQMVDVKIEDNMGSKDSCDYERDGESAGYTMQEKERDKWSGKKKKGIEGIIRVLKFLMGFTAILDIGLFAGLLFNILTYEKMGYLFIGMAILIGLVIIYMHFDPEETPDDIMNEYSKSVKKNSHEKYEYKVQEEVFNIRKDEADNYDGATVLLSLEDDGNLSYIQEEYNNRLFLEASDKDKYSPVYINASSVLVGSMHGSCDYILEEKGISRLHAKLFDKGDGTFIMDMNSTNGTFLNGDMLTAGKEYQIKAGDLIAFADVQYYVMQERAQ